MKKQKIKAFTFVELIVVIVILAILATIGFVNYSSNISDTRNSTRISNLQNLKSTLNSYKQDKGIYPIPGSSFNITNSGMVVAKQGFLNEEVSLSNIDSIPLDPYKDDYYLYSRFRNLEKYELAASIEDNGEAYKAYLVGNYNSVSKNVLPTIMLAKNANPGENIEIHDGVGDGTQNRKLFIFNDNTHNLPYSYGGGEAVSDGTDFDTLLEEAIDSKNFWQNTSFETCDQIKQAAEAISSGYTEEYQVRTSTGGLTNTGCTF